MKVTPTPFFHFFFSFHPLYFFLELFSFMHPCSFLIASDAPFY